MWQFNPYAPFVALAAAVSIAIGAWIRARGRSPVTQALLILVVCLVIDAVGQSHAIEKFQSPLPLLIGVAARQQQRDLYVLDGAQPGDEVERLEEEPDHPVPEAALGAIVDRPGVPPIEEDLPARRKVEAAHQVQERRFPRAGAAHDRDEAPSFDTDADGFEGDDFLARQAVHAAGFDRLDERTVRRTGNAQRLTRSVQEERNGSREESFLAPSRSSHSSPRSDSAPGATTSRKPGTLSPPSGLPSSAGSPRSTSSPEAGSRTTPAAPSAW